MVDDARARRAGSRDGRYHDRHPASGRLAPARIRGERRRPALRALPRRARRGGCFRGRVLGAGGVGLRPGARSARRRSRVADRGLERRGSPGSAPRCPEVGPDRAWQRLLAFVPTRTGRGRSLLHSPSPSSGSRRSAGRWRKGGTRGTTSSTTFSSPTREPPISELQLFRTPLTPIVLGFRSSSAAACCSRSSSASSTRSRSSPGARPRSRSDAFPRSSRRPPARVSRVRDPLPPGVERRRLRDRPRVWALFSRGRCARPRPGGSLRSAPGSPCSCSSGRRIRCSFRSRSCRSSCPSPGGGDRRGRPSAWRGALALLGGWARPQRRPLRRHDRGPRRARLGAVPPRLPRRQDDRPRERRRLEAACRPDRARRSSRSEPHRSLGSARRVPAQRVELRDGPPDRSLGQVLGRDENYDVLFDSALEAIRENPGTYARGVADTFWEFLVQRPLREDVVPREQTAAEPP